MPGHLLWIANAMYCTIEFIGLLVDIQLKKNIMEIHEWNRSTSFLRWVGDDASPSSLCFTFMRPSLVWKEDKVIDNLAVQLLSSILCQWSGESQEQSHCWLQLSMFSLDHTSISYVGDFNSIICCSCTDLYYAISWASRGDFKIQLKHLLTVAWRGKEKKMCVWVGGGGRGGGEGEKDSEHN